jgi:hypothetical protein
MIDAVAKATLAKRWKEWGKPTILSIVRPSMHIIRNTLR